MESLKTAHYREVIRSKYQLENLVYEIDINDKQKLKKHFRIKQHYLESLLLFIPAIAGIIMHAPLYLLIHLTIKNKAEDHYDSVFTGLVFFLYPLYVLLITAITFFLIKSWIAFLLLFLLPLTLWSYVQLYGE